MTDHTAPVSPTVEPDLDYPDWMTPPEQMRPALVRDLVYRRFESIFESVMDRIIAGGWLTPILRETYPDLDSGQFYRWVIKDGDRRRRYEEAKELRTEALSDKMIEHATAPDVSEDVQRSKLIVDTYKWMMGVDNKKRYGDTKTIEFGGQISITAALAEAQNRVGQVIEGEVIQSIEHDPTDKDDDND